jgi:hypothetical protein
MEKISIYAIGLAFMAIGITSCAKSTRGKMINEWKVTFFENTEKSENVNGDKFTSTFSMTENMITKTFTHESPSAGTSTGTQTGTVNAHEFIINKEGTWSWFIDETVVDGSHELNNKITRSGTWSFVSKTKGDDFKKNERILFNVLTMDATDTETANDVIVASNSNRMTYSTGQNTMIYTITESKKDKLEMELESNYTYTENFESYSKSISQKISLESK